jgi:sugar lactone lactonase YvrE
LEDRLCPSQYLLVGDYKTNGAVLRYDGTDGHFIDTFVPPGTGGLKNTEYVRLDGSGQNILLDGSNTNTVWRYSLPDGAPNGSPRGEGATFVAAGSGTLTGPEGMAYGADGNLYVSSTTMTGGDVLRYVGSTGKFMDDFVPNGTGDLSHANDLHFGPDGDLYVSSYTGTMFNNGNLLRYDPTTGAPLPSPGRTGANFIDPLTTALANSFTWGPDGNIYMSSDPVNNSGSVLRFDGQTGDPLPGPGQTGATFIPSGIAGIQFIDDLAFGDDGNLYVTDSFNSTIQRFDGTTGAYIDAFVTKGSGGLVNPGGILFYNDPASPATSLRIGSFSNRLDTVALSTVQSVGGSLLTPIMAQPTDDMASMKSASAANGLATTGSLPALSLTTSQTPDVFGTPLSSDLT